MEYISILILVFLFTLLLKIKFKIKFGLTPKKVFSLFLIFIIVGTIWDSFAVHRGHWIFPEQRTLGIIIGILPIEEYLFFLIVPFFIIIIYKIIIYKLVKKAKS